MSFIILTCNLGTVGNGNFYFCVVKIDIEVAVLQAPYGDHWGKVHLHRWSLAQN